MKCGDVMSCNVRRCVVKCGDAMWNDGVEYGGVLMQDVKCGCGIPSDVEWFDAILDMAVCGGMMVEMQHGMCGVVSNSVAG